MNKPTLVPAAKVLPLRQEYPVTQEPFETAKQIAARLHVDDSTVYSWTRHPRNPIPAYRITNKITLFQWSEVSGWVKAGGTLRRKKAA